MASQKVEAALLPIGDGASSLELIAPQGNDGVKKFLEKRGPGLHHIALEIEGSRPRSPCSNRWACR